MKKTIFIATVFALSILASCQKEKQPLQPIVFSAKIDTASTKTSVDISTGKITWEQGDEITITDGTNTGIYTADQTGAETTFSYKSGTQFTAAAQYSATYGTQPSPGVAQNYSATPGKMIYMEAPQTETTENPQFSFKAKCGLLKLNLIAAGKSIKRIYVNDGTNTYKLVCETVQDISSAKDFYIALPQGLYKTYIIEDNTGYEACKTAKSGKETAISVNTIKKVSFSSLSFVAPLYPESMTPGVKINEIWWAPVNCGYDASNPNGKFYQWAKKQGFASSGFSTSSTLLASMSAGVNCTSFILTPANYSCWYKGIQNSDTWPTDKSYDPCPEGWRVPTKAELTALNNGGSVWDGTAKGQYFPNKTAANKIFLPVPGYLNRENAGLDHKGTASLYWATSVENKDAYRSTVTLFIQENSSSVVTTSYPANGYNVRCVKE